MATEGFSFFADDERNGKDDKTEEKRADGVDVGLKKIGENDDSGTHTDNPAETEFEKELEGLDFVGFFAVNKGVERIDKFIIKAENKSNRATGNTGDAVGKGHHKAAKSIK